MGLYNEFAYSVQGFNHIKVDKECQDASGSYVDDLMSIIVVADGHGSDNYPRTSRGSQFAVDVAIDAIKSFVNTIALNDEGFDINDKDDYRLKTLAKNILMQWHELVDADVLNNPFSELDFVKVSDKYRKKYVAGESVEKAYGTTLMAVCLTDSFWFGIHIGDGKCVAIDKYGVCSEPIPWDEDCQANITTSICDSNAIEEFRYYKGTDLPLAVFLGCDGVDDSYSGDDELYNFYRSILSIFGEHGLDVGRDEVKQYLPQLSRRGSGDDVSIAGLIKSDISMLTVELLKAQVEFENASAENETLSRQCKVAEETVAYLNEALGRTKKSLQETEKKQIRAQRDYERKAADKANAEKRLVSAEQRLNDAKDLMNKKAENHVIQSQVDQLNEIPIVPDATIIDLDFDIPKDVINNDEMKSSESE